MSNDTLLFLHIPKTGGTSVSLALAGKFAGDELYHVRAGNHHGAPRFGRQVGSEQALRRLEIPTKRGLRCVIGHFHFGLHTALPQQCSYFTLLRHPRERYISQVAQYNRMADAGELGPEARAVSLHEFSVIKPLQFTSPQTRWISGLTAAEIAQRRPIDVLELAKLNLVRHFRVVGVVERMRESLAALAYQSDWASLSSRRANVSERRPHIAQFTPAQRAEFDEANQHDEALWNFANRRLDAALATLPDGGRRSAHRYLVRRVVKLFNRPGGAKAS